MTRKNFVLGFFAVLLIAIGLVSTLYLVGKPQELRQQATGPTCPVDGATCSWSPSDGATSYHYKIDDVTSGTLVKEGDVTAPTTQVNFTSEVSKTYKCTITPKNNCGTGSSSNAVSTCASQPTPPPPPICIPDQATCQWDSAQNAASYHFKITNADTGAVVKEGDVTAPTTQVSFTFEPGKNYTCSITAVNACKQQGQSGSVTNSCGAPTPTPQPTSTPTPQPTNTPVPTNTPSPTNTPVPTNTPTPQPTLTPVPTTPITPSPPQAACNNACNVDTDCQTGLACVGGVCRNPSCSSQASCSCAPSPQPTTPPQQPPPPTQPPVVVFTQPTIPPPPPPPTRTIPPTGPGDIFLKIGILGLTLLVIGGTLFFVL